MTGFVVQGHKYLGLNIRCRKHYILFLKMWMGWKNIENMAFSVIFRGCMCILNSMQD